MSASIQHNIDNVKDIEYDPSLNKTSRVLTRYEKTKMLGIRMEQIARGAATSIKHEPGMSVRDIVLKELEARVLPFIIVRTLPNNTKEYYKLEDMIY
jgi:DNA-directed RNA polymerase subunit K/omega